MDMTLDTYLKREGAVSLTDLSAAIGISKGRLSQLRNSTDWPPELAMKAEEVTEGALDASVLSPVIAKARQGLAA
jgi:hypothetical protein